MTVMFIRGLLAGMSLAGDVRKAFGRAGGLVVTGDAVVLDGGEVNAVTGSVDPGDVAGEGVAAAPAVGDRVGLEAVRRAALPGVVADGPVVALDVDPGVGAGDVRAVEGVAGDGAAGGALLDVHG